MILLFIPAILAILLALVIVYETYSFATRPMARGLSRSELKRRYRRELKAKPLPSTIKMKALLAEAKTHYL